MPSAGGFIVRIGSISVTISGPFLEGALWRARGQEITDSGGVYEVEAGTRKGIRGY